MGNNNQDIPNNDQWSWKKPSYQIAWQSISAELAYWLNDSETQLIMLTNIPIYKDFLLVNFTDAISKSGIFRQQKISEQTIQNIIDIINRKNISHYQRKCVLEERAEYCTNTLQHLHSQNNKQRNIQTVMECTLKHLCNEYQKDENRFFSHIKPQIFLQKFHSN